MKRFETKIRVQYYETDKMGIVHHSNYIRWFEEARSDVLEKARTELFRDKGYAYDDMEKSGIWMPVLSVSVDFKTPAVYDEVLILACWVKKLRGASIELEYEIRGEESGEVHVTASSSHGFTTPELKPIRLKREAPGLYEMLKSQEEE